MYGRRTRKWSDKTEHMQTRLTALDGIASITGRFSRYKNAGHLHVTKDAAGASGAPVPDNL
jgi:hypothetical protein